MADLTALRSIRLALSHAADTCRFHGTRFDHLGMEHGEPRCDSCKQPFRVIAARAALERLFEADRAAATDA